MKSKFIPPCPCLSCGKVLDAASSVEDDSVPEPNDFTVCLDCGHLMAFDNGLRFRELTLDEQIEIAGDKRILAIQHARSKITMATNPRPPKPSPRPPGKPRPKPKPPQL